MRRSGLVLLSLFTLLLLPSSLIHAQNSSQIIITVLGASNGEGGFNLDNDAYRDKLIKLFSYTAYNQITQQKLNVERGKTETMSLPQGYELVLLLKSEENQRMIVQAMILKDKQKFLDTSLSILKPGTVFLGGPPFENGDLVLVLEAV